MASSINTPLINTNQALQDYYHSFESRVGYRLVLGGTRHFGYYEKTSWWPFPISKSLRAMEDHLIRNLGLEEGSKVLDAGCGVGHVSIHLAENGYQMQAIDVVDHHILKARRNVKARGLEEKVKIDKGDYHHLDAFTADSFDGAFTMETFVHATDPEAAAAEFYRILRPGGSLALYEYDHPDFESQSKESSTSWQTINKHAAMPANDKFATGVLESILEGAGFEDVVVTDLSDNVMPMLRLFYILAFIPYMIIAALGLKSTFINTVAGYEGYVYRDAARYIAVSARKPLLNGNPGSGEGKKVR